MSRGVLNRVAAGFVSLMAWTLRRCRSKRVEEITTQRVVELVNSPSRNDVVVVDVRSDAETAVSMIPTAITRAEFQAGKDNYKDRLVVAYCTVGGRSLLFSQKMVEEGFRCVNYRDGILGWCESSQRLVRASGEATNEVHTHNRFFKIPDRYEQRT